MITQTSIVVTPVKDYRISEQLAWIGDPCYVLPDRMYDLLHTKLWDESKPLFDLTDGIVVTIDEHYTMLMFHTRYGDGVYQLTGLPYHATLAVDSGNLAVVPASTLAYFMRQAGGHASRSGQLVLPSHAPVVVKDNNLRWDNLSVITGDIDED